MTAGKRSGIDRGTLHAAARMARLPLGEARAKIVGPALEAVFQGVDRLDEIELDETPPASSFDPRW